MQITIHNVNNLKTIDYRKLTNLQGDLKDLTDEGEQKLLAVLQKRGFHACKSNLRTVQNQAYARGWSNAKTMVSQIIDGGSIPTTAHHISKLPWTPLGVLFLLASTTKE